MLELSRPAVIYGDLLEEELADAGLPTGVRLGGVNGELLWLDDLTEDNRAAAQAVVDAHVGSAQFQIDQLNAERTNKSSIQTDARNALAANRNDIATNDNYLNITAPTNAQIAAQVKELTRQSTRQARELNGIIRMLLEDYTGTN